MSKDLPEKVVLAFDTIDKKIKALYEKRQSILKQAMDKYGAAQGVVKVEGEDKPYLRVKIIDQAKNFAEGKPIYVTNKVSELTVEISRLKNPPK